MARRSDRFWSRPKKTFGTNEADTIEGGAGADLIFGRGGDDVLLGLDGDDKLKGGRGNDTLDGGAGNDLLVGGTGNDTLLGGIGNDVLVGDSYGSGSSSARSSRRSDSGSGSAAAMREADDYLDGGAGDDLLLGGAGNDELIGGTGNDVLFGGAGDDLLIGDEVDSGSASGSRASNVQSAGNESADDYLDGGAGNDELIGGAGNDILIGGLGEDRLFGGTGDDLLVGDEMRGSSGSFSGSGAVPHSNDYLDGGAGNDVLIGGQGDDRLLGGTGDDLLVGDEMPGSSGSFSGSDGHIGNADYLDGGAGNDVLLAGRGDDTAVYDLSANIVSGDLTYADVYDAGTGTDTLLVRLTVGESLLTEVAADLQAFEAFLATHANPHAADGPAFDFSAFGLQVRNFEAVSVEIVNNAPIAGDDDAATDEDSPTVLNVLSNDDDIDRLDRIEVVEFDATSAAGATVTVAADGTAGYDPGGLFQGLALGESATDSFTYTIADLAGARATATVTVHIAGVNDGPEIDAAASVVEGGVTEIADGGPGENVDVLSTGGSIAFSDVDVTDTHEATHVAQETGYRGTFSLQPPTTTDTTTAGTVAWTFAIDDADVDDLADGQVLTQRYDVTVDDGNGGTATETVVVTITGTNDAPVIDGTASTLAGGVEEIADGALGENAAVLSTGGAIAFSDVDVSDTHEATHVAQETGYRGTFGVQAPTTTNATTAGAVAWTFTIADADIDDLADGQVLTQRYDVTIDDGNGGTATETVVVTITGTNDAPVIDGTASTLAGGVEEIADGALGENAAVLSTGGAIAFSDVDVSDTHEATHVAQETGYRGTFGVQAPTTTNATTAGAVAWTFEIADADVDDLADGQVLTQRYDVTIDDGNGGTATETVIVSITGTNDAPVIDGAVSTLAGGVEEIADGALGENAAILSTGGAIAFSDVDVTDTHEATHVAQETGYRGTFGLQSPTTTNATTAGTVAWTFAIADADVDDLADGQVLTQRYDVTVDDGNGGTATETVVVTITGTNDAPVITSGPGDAAGAVTEAGNLDDGTIVSGIPSATGTLTSSDADQNATATWSIAADAANTTALGSMVIDPATGVWTYTLDNVAADSLDEGDVVIETFDATVTDDKGATDTQTVTVTILGTNDAPVAVADDVLSADGTRYYFETDFNVSPPQFTLFSFDGSGAPQPVPGVPTFQPAQPFFFSPPSLTKQGDAIFFTASTATGGTEIWSLDDVTGTVTQISNFAADANVPDISFLPQIGDDRYISVNDFTGDGVAGTASGLYRLGSDGTLVQISGLDVGPGDFGAGVTEIDGNIYASVRPIQNGQITDEAGLFLINGDDTATRITRNGDGEPSKLPFGLDSNGVRYYFETDFSVSPPQFTLFSFDGSGAPQPVPGVPTFQPAQPFFFSPPSLTKQGDAIFFTASTATGGTEIWSLDDVTGTVTQISNFAADANVPDISFLPQIGDDRYISVNDFTGDGVAGTASGLYRLGSDGTLVQISGLDVGPGDFGAGVTEIDGNIYASVRPIQNGQITDEAGLFLINGDDTATRITRNGDGEPSKLPFGLDSNGVRYYFETDFSVSPPQFTLFSFDGSGAPQPVPGVPTFQPAQPFFFSPPSLTKQGDAIFFTASTATGGTEIWSLDDVTGTVTQISNFAADANVPDISFLPQIGDDRYISVNDFTGDGVAGTASGLYRLGSDGTLVQISGLDVGPGDFGAGVTEIDGNIYASVRPIQNGQITDEAGLFLINGDDTATRITRNGDGEPSKLPFGLDVSVERPIRTDENSAITVDVLANDTDVDADDSPANFSLDTVAIASVAGPPGLTLGTGAVSIVGNEVVFDPLDDFDALAVGETATVVVDYTMSDDTDATASSTLTLQVTGTNDAPIVGAADTSGGVTEITDNAAGENNADLTDTGTIAFTDVDLADAHSVSVNLVSATDSANGSVAERGSLAAIVSDAATGDGSGEVTWTFTVNDGALNDLADGQTITQVYTVTIDDDNGGTATETVVVTITGTNDAPVIDGTASTLAGGVEEIADGALGENVGVLSTGGAIAFSDVDVTDTHEATHVAQETGYRGTFTLQPPTTTNATTAGTVAWTLEIADADIDDLAEGQVLTQRYDVTVDDGNGGTATETVVVTITGTNDAPVIDGTASTLAGGVEEIADGALGENAAVLSTGGAIAFSDVDVTDTHEATHVAQETGYRGTFGLEAPTTTNATTAGTVAWTFEIDDADIDDLAEGQVLTQRYDVTVDDGNGGTATETVVVTITGTNDSPEIASEVLAGQVFEDDGARGQVSGTIVAEDVDATDTLAWSVLGGGDGAYGRFDVGQDGTWTYTLDNAVPDLETLDTGERVGESFVVRIDDDKGGVVDRTVQITINGNTDNNPPDVTAIVDQTDDDQPPYSVDLADYVSDADPGDTVTLGNVRQTGGPTVAYTVTGTTLSVDPRQLDALNLGDSETLVFSYDATDGKATVTNTVTLEVAGANDLPVAYDGLAFTNQDEAVTGGFRVEDVDSGPDITIEVTDGPAHGSVVLNADGSYTYTPNAGFSGRDSFIWTATDADGGTSPEARVDINVQAGIPDVRYLNDITDDAVASGSVQADTQVVALEDGGHLVVWAEYDSGGSNSYDVFMRRYDAGGEAVGAEAKLNTTTANDQFHPSVAVLDDGGWVAVWQSYQTNGDNSREGIVGQRFAANGDAVGGEFLVNQTTNSVQLRPQVTALANGGFAVTWNSDTASNLYDVLARVYAANGQAVTNEFTVNTTTAGYQYTRGFVSENIAGLSDGSFVIVWMDNNNADGSGSGIFARRFAADGSALDTSEVQVNTTTVSTQDYASVAALSDGGYVVTWGDANSADGSGWGVFQQRFAANGDTVGGEEQVNSFTYSTQYLPKVVGLDGGGWVVVWQSYGVTGDSSYEISGQRYDADGNAVGGEFIVNDRIPGNQEWPSIAERDDGALVVTWRDSGNSTISQKIIESPDDVLSVETLLDDTVASGAVNPDSQVVALADGGHLVVWSEYDRGGSNTWDVFMRRYDAGGEAVGAEAKVNTTTANNQFYPSVAVLDDGGWVAVWQSYQTNGDNSREGIVGQRFAANGDAVGGEFLVNQTTNSVQLQPQVTALANGGFAVTWNSDTASNLYDVLARVYAANGQAVTNEFTVNTTTANYQYTRGFVTENIAGLSDGSFVIVWTDRNNTDGSGSGIFARRFAADGSALDTSEVQVNTTTAGGQDYASVAALSDGGYVVTWGDASSTDGSSWGVFQQRFAANGDTVGGEEQVNSFTNSTQIYPKVVGLDGGGWVVVWQSFGVEDSNSYEISGQRYDADGNAVGGEFIVNDRILGSQEWPSIAERDDGALVVTWRDGGSSTISQKIIESPADVRPIETLLDDIVASGSVNPDSQVIALADGGHLVVWTEYDSGGSNTWDAFMRRYDAGGEAVGAEVKLGTTTTNAEFYPSVAALDDGGWLAVWQSDGANGDNSGYGIVGQRFAANGDAVGGEFLVNQTTNNSQFDAQVTVLANGGYAVTWNSYTASNLHDVLARVYAANGQAVTNEFTVNTTTANYQYTRGFVSENIAGLSDGSFVIVWTDSNNTDGSGSGIFARRFAADGSALDTSEVQVNTTTVSTQDYASVAALSDGGYVVTWGDANSADGSGWGVFQQRFAANGDTVGGEEQVNSFTNSTQYLPKVVGLDGGGWVVVWQSYGVTGDSSYDISGQRYDPDGNAVGGEFIVNDRILGNQEWPSIAERDDGALVVTWADRNAGFINQKIIANFSGSVEAKNITGGDGADSFVGSDFDDTFDGGAGADRFDGGLGDDTLIGGAGDDLFVINDGDGNDTIEGFVAGADTDDVIELVGFGFASGADVIANASASGNDTVIQLDADDTVTLLGVLPGQLDEDDFFVT